MKRQVKVIRRQKKAMLVEWLDDDGHYRRGVLPPKSVNDGRCDDEELDRSIEHGEAWAELIEWPTASQIQQELYRHGLWTYDDILNSADVRGVIMRPFESALVSLLRLAKQNRRV